MNNPMMNQLNQMNSQLNSNNSNMSWQELYSLVRNASNPAAMLSQIAKTNPQLQSVLSLVQQNGGDPKRAFFELAQQKGIDPNSVLNMLR